LGEEVREAVEAREWREAALDFVEVWEAVEGRADREAILPGMVDFSQHIY
jgi:hypothetical protein